MKKNWKVTIMVVWAFSMAGVFLLGTGGCSMVEGAAQDVGAMSRAMRSSDTE